MHDLEAWIHLYHEEMTYARHHESLRTKSANLIVVATGAVLALIASEAISLEEQPSATAILAFFIVIVNVLGLLMGEKHYERTRRHQSIAQAYRQVISDNCNIDGLELSRVRENAIYGHNEKYRCWTARVRAHSLWGVLHLAFVALGLIVLANTCCAR